MHAMVCTAPFTPPGKQLILKSKAHPENKKAHQRHNRAILDLHSRKVISHKISHKHSSQLITSTFRTDYKECKSAGGLTFHSDRGVIHPPLLFKSRLRRSRWSIPFLLPASLVTVRP